jgi:hypothetical protein
VNSIYIAFKIQAVCFQYKLLLKLGIPPKAKVFFCVCVASVQEEHFDQGS